MVNEVSLPARIGVLLGCVVLLTVLNSYIPHELSPIRVLVALIQLCFMAATMAVMIQWVLEDY